MSNTYCSHKPETPLISQFFLAVSSIPTRKCNHQHKLGLVRQRNRGPFTLLIEGGEKEERGCVRDRKKQRQGQHMCMLGTHIEFQKMTYSSQFFL